MEFEISEIIHREKYTLAYDRFAVRFVDDTKYFDRLSEMYKSKGTGAVLLSIPNILLLGVADFNAISSLQLIVNSEQWGAEGHNLFRCYVNVSIDDTTSENPDLQNTFDSLISALHSNINKEMLPIILNTEGPGSRAASMMLYNWSNFPLVHQNIK